MKMQIFYGIFLCFFIFLAKTQAAVTIDNTSSHGVFDTITGVTTMSWTHTVNSCADCVLYVGISTFTQSNIPTARVLSVTYGTQTLTAVGTQVSPFPSLPSLGNSSVEMFRLIAPSVGTFTVTVNFIVPVNYAVGGAHSLNGVSQTTPNSAFFTSSGNSSAPAVVATGAITGDLVLDTLGTTPNAIFVAPDMTQTLSYDGRQFFSFAFDVGAGSTEAPSAANVPMNWAMTNSAVWALGAIVVKQSVVTSSMVSISGKVFTVKGNAINDAVVILQDFITGEERRVMVNKRGFYRFDELEVLRLYQIRVINKNYYFPVSSQIVNLSEAVENLDFIGIEN
jgi:hypothetical protein